MSENGETKARSKVPWCCERECSEPAAYKVFDMSTADGRAHNLDACATHLVFAMVSNGPLTRAWNIVPIVDGE